MEEADEYVINRCNTTALSGLLQWSIALSGMLQWSMVYYNAL